MSVAPQGVGSHNSGAGQYSVSDSGWLAYAPGRIYPTTEDSLVRVDYKGDAQPVGDFTAPFYNPRFSPDGRRIAYRTKVREQRVWVYDLNRRTASRLTGDGMAMLGYVKGVCVGYSQRVEPRGKRRLGEALSP